MHRFLIFLAFATSSVFGGTGQSKQWTGRWAGVLKIQETELAIMFQIEVKNAGWYTRVYVPQQNLKDHAASSTLIEKKNITIQLDLLDANYSGRKTDSNTIVGYFHQNGQSIPLKLKRVWGDWPALKPQTPRAPYAYVSENISVYTASGRVKIAGTLTKPDSHGIFPAIILISGSGPQDRNGSIGDHRPLLLLADRFTKLGFAVFRYDDRGAGETRGHMATLVQTTTEDVANDVLAMLAMLKSRTDIDTSFMGLIGHSEGAIVAPLIANKSNDIAFIVSLAGPAVGGLETNVFQNREGLKKAKIADKHIQSYEIIHRKLLRIIADNSDTSTAHRLIASALLDWEKRDATRTARRIIYASKKKNIQHVFQTYDAFQLPWWRFFLSYDAASAYRQLHCPILALNGDEDMQVPCEPNLKIIADSFGDKSSVTTQCIPGLNHLFQKCETCNLSEYYSLDETFSEEAIAIISKWLLQQLAQR